MSTERLNLTDLRTNLESLKMQELRSRAKNYYGVSMSRDDTASDIINKIIGVAQKADFAMASEGDIKPGWARIVVQPTPGRQYQQHFNCNDYHVFIPLGVEVDVPIKMLEVIKNCTEPRTVQDANDVTIFSEVEVYPVSVKGITPGPDPRPGLEVSRARRQAPKKAFLEAEGYWPSDEVVKAWLKDKSFKESMRDQLE